MQIMKTVTLLNTVGHFKDSLLCT